MLVGNLKLPGWAAVAAGVIVGGAAAAVIASFAFGPDPVFPAYGVQPQFVAGPAPLLAATPVAWQPLPGQPPAGTGGAPVIRAGAVPAHADRGVCTACHTVVGAAGAVLPAVSGSSVMLHGYRGVCSNCHRIAGPQPPVQLGGPTAPTPGVPWATAVPPLAAAVPPLAAAAPPFAAAAPPLAAAAPPFAAAAPFAPTEGEWLGLEVSPITGLTANQYRLPPGSRGLVVAEAEAQAQAAGLRAGDVVVAIDGIPITDMVTFFQATRSGSLAQGTVRLQREGRLFEAFLQQAAAAPAQPPSVGTLAPVVGGGGLCPPVATAGPQQF